MATEKISSLTRLYVWSIVLEPLLFFVIADRTVAGIGGNISRILQFIVILGLLVRLLNSSSWPKVANPFNPLYRNYTYYFLLVVLAGIIGLLQGAYTINFDSQSEVSGLARFLNGPFIRPFFEYFITLYYFVYFCILPSYLVKTDRGIDYFFKVFFRMFVLGLMLGYIDLFLAVMGYDWIPRHMLEGVHVGLRFHGIAGEPRDAFVYMLLSLAILNLQQYWINRCFINTKWIIIIFLTMLLTQSASGLLGLLFASVLIFIYSRARLSIKSILQMALVLSSLVLIIYIGFISSPRLMRYFAILPELMSYLKEGGTVPLTFLGQMANIYPLWDFYTSIINFDIIKVFFGQGLGSASIINSILYRENDVMNPNSEVVRLIFESGIAGLLLFIFAFVYPVRLLTKKISKKIRKRFIIILLLLIGGFLGHRSSALFIYLGIFILVMQKIDHKQEITDGLGDSLNLHIQSSD